MACAVALSDPKQVFEVTESFCTEGGALVSVLC